MKFALIYMTLAMVQGPTNLGDLPKGTVLFSDVDECHRVRSILAHGARVNRLRPGWDCIPYIPPGS